jgi:hypothetical protein
MNKYDILGVVGEGLRVIETEPRQVAYQTIPNQAHTVWS